MRSAPPRPSSRAPFTEIIGSGNPEAHDYAAGLPDDYEVEPVILELEPSPQEPAPSITREDRGQDVELRRVLVVEHVQTLVRLLVTLSPDATAADVLGLDRDHELAGVLAAGVVLPWERELVLNLDVHHPSAWGLARRSGSPLWHHVLSGLFTEDEALSIFDRCVAGVM